MNSSIFLALTCITLTSLNFVQPAITNRTIPAIIDIMLPYLKIGRLQIFQGPQCYNEVGCFHNNGSFRNLARRPFSLVPENPDTIATKFLLWTNNDQQNPQIITVRNFTESGLDPKARIVIAIHGYYYDNFFGEYQKSAFAKLKSSLFKLEKINYIFIDWGLGATTWYLQATANTRIVGAQVAFFINRIIKKYKITGSKIWIIGHSLGAHVAGYAGSKIKNIGRITGLDPAKPYFDGMPDEVVLDGTDAILVDVLHTNAPQVLHPFGFGTRKQVGHIDFYLNGGNAQPGCIHEKFQALFETSLEMGIQKVGICNHERSILFFAEALTNPKCKMVAFKCSSYDSFKAGKCFSCGENQENCRIIGDPSNAKQHKQGFYLMTNPEPPYCAFHYRIELTLSGPFEGTKNKFTATLVAANVTASGQSEIIMVQQQRHSLAFITVGDNVDNLSHIVLKWTPVKWARPLMPINLESLLVTPMSHLNDKDKLSLSKSAGKHVLYPFQETKFVLSLRL